MKAVILAGGLGTRITEETILRPKPMVEIGGKPILWHVMQIYSNYGINEFIICAGYKGYMIKEYFANYFMHRSDVTFDLKNNDLIIHNHQCEPWKVTVVDTGEETMTGSRLKKVTRYLGNEDFCLTYGDGVSDVDIVESIKFHKAHGKLATLTAVAPAGRFGALEFGENNKVASFQEKPKGDGSYINAGFFIVNPKVIDYIGEGENCIWEREPLEKLAQESQLQAFKHEGFWQPMDTLRDKIKLEELCKDGNAPWLRNSLRAKTKAMFICKDPLNQIKNKNSQDVF
ncbi:MAG: glucose-1-phosphate cytidylyltransferase [Cyanobacteria bacterium]|nr:glucose-1-phosphate cytidylyltransferase [Cyanobacteriota bacterium]